MLIAASIGIRRIEKEETQVWENIDAAESKMFEFERTISDLSPDWLNEGNSLTADFVIGRLVAIAGSILKYEADLKSTHPDAEGGEQLLRSVLNILSSERELFKKMWGAAAKFGIVHPRDKQRIFGIARERLEKSEASKQD
jgi:hypothetical protein